jgi:hypothetical protein
VLRVVGAERSRDHVRVVEQDADPGVQRRVLDGLPHAGEQQLRPEPRLPREHRQREPRDVGPELVHHRFRPRRRVALVSGREAEQQQRAVAERVGDRERGAVERGRPHGADPVRGLPRLGRHVRSRLR